MEINYQCGTPSKVWKINMFHNGKRYLVSGIEIDASVEASQLVNYTEAFDMTDPDNPRLVTRVAELRFSEPVIGTAVIQAEELESL